MSKRVSLGYSGPIETRLHFDGDVMVSEDIMHGRQVQAILDQNQRDRSMGHRGHTAGRHAARIPMPMLADWYQDWERNHSDKWEWMTFLTSKINSRDYSKLRTGVDKL